MICFCSYVDGKPHKAGDAVFSDGSRFSGIFKEGLPEKGLFVCLFVCLFVFVCLCVCVCVFFFFFVFLLFGNFKLCSTGDWTLSDGSTSISGKFSGSRLAGRGL